MLEMIIELGNRVANGGMKVHLAAYAICLVVGIALLRMLFAKLFDAIAKRTELSLPLLQQTFRGIPTLLGILIGLYAAMELLTIPPRPLLFMQHLFHSIVILAITLLVAHLCSGYLKHKLGQRSEKLASTSILITAIDIIVYAIGALVLLESFGVSISPLITALGVGGLATALALQDTLANLFSGINILVSKQIKMGDFVKLASGEEGHVVDMNWRNTTIKTPTENMTVVPNQKIASSILTNYAQPFAECAIAIPLGVAYGSDLDQVEALTIGVAQAVLQEIDGGVKEFIPVVRYSGFGDSGVQLQAVLRVNAITDQQLIRHEFIKRIYACYRREGISIVPLPKTLQ